LHDEVGWHARAAMNLGVIREKIIEVIVQCSPYIGLTTTNHALRAVMRVFKELDAVKPA
jgi:alkylhydroperoxidase/carboxymuconolactone decarboxylase family protein YurZ